MSGQNHQPRQRMVGDLPLLPSSHWWGISDSCLINVSASDLERVQHLMHCAGEGEDFIERYIHPPSDNNDEKSVVLTSTHKAVWRRHEYDAQTPYHEDLLPHWNAFSKKLMKRHGLERLKIERIDLPTAPFFARKLAPVLRSNNLSLTCLELRSCKLKPRDVERVANFLSKNETLSILDLSSNKIECLKSTKKLSSAMKNHNELSFVNLSGCHLGQNNGILYAVLDGSANLTSLLLDDNDIKSKEGVGFVADFLTENTSLAVFSMLGDYYPYWSRGGTRGLDKDSVKVISRAVHRNGNIRELCLGSCKISIPTILRSSRVMENLTHLDLSRNDIKAPGAELIAQYLEGNPALIELDLTCNKIPPKAAVVLAEALKSNVNLEHLNLCYNNLNDKCVPALADTLKSNSTLCTLNVSGNSIKLTTGRRELIRSAICDMSSLQAIAASNHTCNLIMVDGTYKNHITYEKEMRAINSLDSDAQKIRYKVTLALFTLEPNLFSPSSFADLPLELMPRLLDIVQHEVGYNGFGKGIVKYPNKRYPRGTNPTLRRVYEVITGWNKSLLFMRGPGKLRKKRKCKRKYEDDANWTPRDRGSGF